MDSVLFQLGLGGDPLSMLLSFVMLIAFFMFYPRLMLTQIMWKLEKTAAELEQLSKDSKDIVSRAIAIKQDRKLKESINRFYEFFLIPPMSLDPYGVVKKIEHVVQGQRDRFEYFVRQLDPQMDDEKVANIQMGLSGGITVYQISKVVRHYVEIVRKTKSFQIAMILQMQLPLIERMARSIYKGTKVMSKGMPIGDALGPYVVARLAGKTKMKDIGEDIVFGKIIMDGKELLLMKAKGPGGRLGRPGYMIAHIAKQYKIAKIISIDAAAKMEGERTGSVAEGIGVAMGGIGVERTYIEEVAVKNKIPLDSVIVKMSQEEAIEPLRKSIIDAYPQVIEAVKRSLETVKKGSKVLVVGVGNTSGVGNSEKETAKAEEWAAAYTRELEAKKKKKNKGI